MDKTKDNKIIAEFMGYEKVTVNYFGTKKGKDKETKWQVDNREWIDSIGIEAVGEYIVKVQENEYIDWEDVAYDTSWDWLMPVVQKIKNIKASEHPDFTSVNWRRQVIDMPISRDIKSVYDKVVRYIKHYNSNPLFIKGLKEKWKN